MKNQIYIPRKRQTTIRKTNKPKLQYTEERKPLGEVCKENGIDTGKLSKLINLTFLLSDVMENLVMEVDTELKKADQNLRLELSHPISRIKVHASEMVKFVDNTLGNNSASLDFGEKSDEIRKMLENYFK